MQNYTIRSLQKHTNYVIKLAAKNLQGVGPYATIELRTEDGGKNLRAKITNIHFFRIRRESCLSWSMLADLTCRTADSVRRFPPLFNRGVSWQFWRD